MISAVRSTIPCHFRTISGGTGVECGMFNPLVQAVSAGRRFLDECPNVGDDFPGAPAVPERPRPVRKDFRQFRWIRRL